MRFVAFRDRCFTQFSQLAERTLRLAAARSDFAADSNVVYSSGSVVFRFCLSSSPLARSWARALRFFDMCNFFFFFFLVTLTDCLDLLGVECDLAVPLATICDFGGIRLLAIARISIDCPSILPPDNADALRPLATLTKAFKCSCSDVFHLSVARGDDAVAYVVGGAVTPTVIARAGVAQQPWRLPLRFEAVRLLGANRIKDMVPPLELGATYVVRRCTTLANARIEHLSWHASLSHNAQSLVRVLRACGLNQRLYGLARTDLVSGLLAGDVDTPLLLHCVAVVIKRALMSKWATVVRGVDGTDAFERRLRDAAAAVLNDLLLPWVPELGSSGDEFGDDSTATETSSGGVARTPPHAALREALRAHFGSALLDGDSGERASFNSVTSGASTTQTALSQILSRSGSSDGLASPRSSNSSANNSARSSSRSSGSSRSHSSNSNNSSSSSSTSTSSDDEGSEVDDDAAWGELSARAAMVVDPLRRIKPPALFDTLERVAGIVYNRRALHALTDGLPFRFSSEHITLQCVAQAERHPTLRVSLVTLYELSKTRSDHAVAVERELSDAIRLLDTDDEFRATQNRWRVSLLRGVLGLVSARMLLVSTTDVAQCNAMLELATSELSSASRASPNNPHVAFALASAEYSRAHLDGDHSSMLRAIERQQRAAELAPEYLPFVGDKKVAVDDPEQLDYYKTKLWRKSLLPMDLETLNLLVAHKTIEDGEDEDDGDDILAGVNHVAV